MRSHKELAFRLRQETANLRLWLTGSPLSQSGSVEQPSPLPGLPDPGPVVERLRGTAFHAEVERLADGIVQHRFPLLGTVIDTGKEIDWRRDYQNHRTTGTSYFRFIPYLDFSRVGDHKVIWELNRHQHLVLLAQACRLSSREKYFEEIERQIKSWLKSNPFMRGINWASALEVAFRALSWIWIYHLTGERMTASFRQLFLEGLYRHGRYLEQNLSIYFSPNTHLLGEAVALHAIGALFDGFPKADKWKQTGAQIVTKQMHLQVCDDGSHFEQSAYYHVYALDLFLFHHTIAEPGSAFREKLERMAVYLDALLGRSRTLPMLGDDDGGRVFHPYGSRDRFARATLATCAVLFERANWAGGPEDLYEQGIWWLGAASPDRLSPGTTPPVMESRLFPQSRLAVMASGEFQLLMDAGQFGAGSAGHSHSDTLSMLARLGDEQILIDPGTYTYVAGQNLRDWFRGSAAHNTVRVDGNDQALPSGPFRWTGKPAVFVRQWKTAPVQDFIDAIVENQPQQLSHRRQVLFLKPDLIFILDEVRGPDGEHFIEQFWHCGEAVKALSSHCFRIGTRSRLVLPDSFEAELSEGGEHGWRSRVFGEKVAAPVIRVWRKSILPVCLGAVLDFTGGPGPSSLRLDTGGESTVSMYYAGINVQWGDSDRCTTVSVQ